MLKRVFSSLDHPHRAIKLFTLLPIGFVYCVHFSNLKKKNWHRERREAERYRSLPGAQMVPRGLDCRTTQTRRTADGLACGVETTALSPLDVNFSLVFLPPLAGRIMQSDSLSFCTHHILGSLCYFGGAGEGALSAGSRLFSQVKATMRKSAISSPAHFKPFGCPPHFSDVLPEHRPDRNKALKFLFCF